MQFPQSMGMMGQQWAVNNNPQIETNISGSSSFNSEAVSNVDQSGIYGIKDDEKCRGAVNSLKSSQILTTHAKYPSPVSTKKSEAKDTDDVTAADKPKGALAKFKKR